MVREGRREMKMERKGRRERDEDGEMVRERGHIINAIPLVKTCAGLWVRPADAVFA